MTGFARVAVEVNAQSSYVLTLKSVNHRFLDLHLRLPNGHNSFDALEMDLRKALKAQLLRGHVECTLQIDRSSQQQAGYNRELVASYVKAFQAAADEFELQGQPDLNVVLRMPGVMQAESRWSEDDNAAITASVLEHLPALIDALKAMRLHEGAALTEVLHATLDRLTLSVDGVAALRPEVEARYQQRLTERLEAALGGEGIGINRQRLLEEVALLVERSDVSEEIARMETHIQHFRDVLAVGGETGKKLDFLLQEMNREANTLLSKTAGVAGRGTQITELGLSMKAEIEKAREQIMNLE
jgi:uncharacterized protein (TIGR00255 family)